MHNHEKSRSLMLLPWKNSGILPLKHFQQAHLRSFPGLNVLVFVFGQHSTLFEIVPPPPTKTFRIHFYVSPTARHGCDVSSEVLLTCLAAEMDPALVTRFGVISRV